MFVNQGNTWVKFIDFGLTEVAGTQREYETMNVGTCHTCAKDFIRKIFVPQHNQRISIWEILVHKWIDGNGLLKFLRLFKKAENPYFKNSKRNMILKQEKKCL